MAKFYLSSTFRDLEECREQVYRTLSRMDHKVIGMENYTAETRAPLEKCLSDVSECDVYLGIFAWRYGFIPPKDNPDKKAITELEYREASRLRKHRLIFILRKDAPWPGDRFAEDEKERRRINALREELCESHTVSFFTDGNELAILAGIAASKFAVSDIVQPLPPPSPPPEPSWRTIAELWIGKTQLRLILGAIVATLAILVAISLSRLNWKAKSGASPPLAASSPMEHTNNWEAKFTSMLDEQWLYPHALWDTEPGQATEVNPQAKALLVKGREMGIPNDLADTAFYNFKAIFKVRFKSGTGAAWVLRAQPDRQSGYLFEINKAETKLLLTGWIFEGNRERAKFGEETLYFDRCCTILHDLNIDVRVEDNTFNYVITFEDDTEQDPQAGREVALTFRVEGANDRWRSGTFGFIGTEDGSVMKVEDLKIIPLPRKT